MAKQNKWRKEAGKGKIIVNVLHILGKKEY